MFSFVFFDDDDETFTRQGMSLLFFMMMNEKYTQHFLTCRERLSTCFVVFS